jgi:uncharacterized protein
VTCQSALLRVKIIPKASKSEVVGWENGELRIRLAAIPDKGRANLELIAFLAKFLEIAKSQITLIRGKKSRHKHLMISGISDEASFLARLNEKIRLIDGITLTT